MSLHSAAEMIIMNFATSSAADAVVVAVLVVRKHGITNLTCSKH